MTVPYWVVALFGLAFVLLVIILWSVKRRRRPRLDLQDEGGIKETIPSIVGITQGTLQHGNRVELLQNGLFFDRLFADLEAARESITVETFLCKPGEVIDRLFGILARKAREGIDVRMTLDAGGSRFVKKQLPRLREAGVKVARYHPFLVRNLGTLNNRDHRKIVVVDGRIGYVGGHCMVDAWLGDAEDRKHFRDVTARVEGPVVAQLQSAFSENAIEETGHVPGGERFFPRLEPCGDVPAHVVFVSPAGSPSAVQLLHYLAIHAAKKSVTIQNPYFLPDRDARDALLDAVKRGVEVRVMIPHESASDAAYVQHASHHHYGTLLEGGVKLYEYRRTLLHQKTMTVDGCWSAVGSTNFDDRSFEVNDEVSFVMISERLAEELERTFERDMEHATVVTMDEWRRRSPLHKLQDFMAFLVSDQL